MEDNKAKIILSAEDQLTGVLNKAGGEMDGFAAKATRMGAQLESAGLRIGAMGLAANTVLAKMNLDLGSLTKSALDAEHALLGIASTANIYGAAGADAVGKWSVALDKIAKDTNQTKAQVITAFQDMVAQGINEKDAMSMLAPIGKAATATGATIRDITVAATAGFSKMHIPTDQLAKTLDILARAGDLGKFELKDMAGYFDMLTAKAADLGIKGQAGMAQLAAAAQVARIGTGDASQAATNLSNWLDKLNASVTYKAFEKAGADLDALKEKARASGDFIGSMLQQIKDLTHGGNESEISALFADVQAGGFVRLAVRELEKYTDLAGKAAAATGDITNKYGTMMQATSEKMKGAEINLSTAITNSNVIKNVLERLEGLADWAAKHPDLAAFLGIGLATAASAGLVGGAVIAGIGATITAVVSLTGVMSALGVVLLANPIIAILLGVGLVGAVIYTQWDDIVAALSGFWAKIKAMFAESDAWLKATFLSLNPLPIIQKSFDAVSVYFSGVVQSWKDAGVGLIDALKAGITERLQGALGIGEKISAAITYLKGEASKWAQIGSDLMQGLLDGIFAKYAEIINRIKSLGSDMIKTVKNVLGIHSPSKEFYNIGVQTGEGLENGLLATEQSVAEAAGKLGTSSIDTVKESLAQLKSEGASLTASMRTEQEKASDALERYKKLLDEDVISLETYNRAVTATSKTVANFDAALGKGLRDSKGRFLPAEEAAAALAVWQRTSDDISKSLTDALMRGFESGKNFAKVFRDTLKNMFSTLILQPQIKLIAQGGANWIMSLFGLGGAGSAVAGGSSAAGGGGSGDLLSLASTLRTGYQAVTNFFSGGSSAAAAAPNYYAATAPGAAPAAGATSALSTAATYLGYAAAGFVIGKMISGGFSAFGKSGNVAVLAGQAIGAFFGPVGIIIGGAIGGLVNRMFGRKLTETGIQGKFGGQGFAGENYTFEKGGWFRSDKTSTSPLDKAMDDSMDESYQQLKLSALVLGNVFKDTSKSLDDFTYDIKLNFLGLNEEQSKAMLTGELTKMGDAMAAQVLSDIARAEMATAGITTTLADEVEKTSQEIAHGGVGITDTLTRFAQGIGHGGVGITDTVTRFAQEIAHGGVGITDTLMRFAQALNLGGESITDTNLTDEVEKYWKQFARGGESATDTLTRLSGSLAGVNGWLAKMGMELYATTLAAGNMASELVDLFGSMDKFTAAVQKYVSIYFSASERLSIANGEIGASFEALGFKLPGTLEEMRAMIEAQDLTTASGRETYAALINLSEGFAGLYQSSGQAAIGGRTLMKAWEDQNAALKGLIDTYDGSTASEAALTVAARSRYQIELALIKQIDAALQSTHQMFANTIDEMKFSTLDNEGKYNYLRDKSAELETLFNAATDPAEITRLAAELNQVSRDAWMLLSAEEKKIKLSAYVDYLNELDATAKTRLDFIKAKVKDEGGDYKSTNEAITAAIAAGIAAGMASAAAGFEKAASTMQAAADTPVKVDQTVHVDVHVDAPANVEVGIA